MIALASGKKLKDCIKVDFRPFDERVFSASNMQDMFKSSECMDYQGVSNTIKNIFTPEDVEISETLYCLWITE